MTTVTITTAVKLTSQQLTKLETALTQKYGRDLQLVQAVDPAIIGGLKVQIGSTELNATIQDKLNRLRSELLAAV